MSIHKSLKPKGIGKKSKKKGGKSIKRLERLEMLHKNDILEEDMYYNLPKGGDKSWTYTKAVKKVVEEETATTTEETAEIA